MEKGRDLKIPKNLYLMLQCACYFSRPMHLQFDGASLPDNVNFSPLPIVGYHRVQANWNQMHLS